ncbi:hypothetical protein CCR91_00760 [Thiorhodovibrio winogradskyi]|nr:hypothetical protein [Thiorhodovibrio winogradskyi]
MPSRSGSIFLRGRALDNVFVERLWRSVKWEDIYPKGYETALRAVHGAVGVFPLLQQQTPPPGARLPNAGRCSSSRRRQRCRGRQPLWRSPASGSANPLRLNWAR